MRFRVLAVSLAACLCFPLPTAARTGDDDVTAPGMEQQVDYDYQLGPGDLLSVRVTGVREFDQTARVSNSGRIRIPYVGVMFVAGMTTVQLERDIARTIKEHQLVNEPTVRVQVEDYRARPTYVIGEVNAPGQFVITGEMYLLDLISKAGGLLASAADKGYLYRRSWPKPSTDARLVTVSDVPQHPPADRSAGPGTSVPGPEPEEVIEVNFDELRSGSKPELNVRLQGGDVLYVPRRRPQNIYIIGEVKVPGAYTLPRRGQITAAQAVIYAGGPLPTARVGKGFLMRHDEAGVRQAIPVDFAAIIEGRAADFPVRPDDILFIPSSGVKTVGVGLLNLVPRLIQQFLIF